jgi:hypothetical protein
VIRGIVRRIFAGVIMILLALVAPPARGQTQPDGWEPTEAQPVESAGEIVLTFTSSQPGRVAYYTSDGDCSRYPLDPPDCGRPQARASEDYGAVKGEWIFTEAGSRTIRIPIYDDDTDEADSEAFAVNASRYDDVAEQTTWTNVLVRIVDDDPKDDSEEPPATATATTTPTATTPGGRSSSSSATNAISGSDDGGQGPNLEIQPAPDSELASDEPGRLPVELPAESGSELMHQATSAPAARAGGCLWRWEAPP